jgi:hypothetical protein
MGVKTVISLCDRTGNMVKPWLGAGYRALTIDLQHAEPEHRNHGHLVWDVRHITLATIIAHMPIAAIFAFPPCTHLASSGARWFKEKGIGKLIEGLEVVEACRLLCEGSQAPWMLENPVGTLATYWRDPDYTFDPCDYGDPYTKKTCLWVGGGFVMPPVVKPGDMFAKPTWVEPTLGSMIHRMPPSKDRGDLRSVTPMGFALAVFNANARDHLMTAAE